MMRILSADLMANISREEIKKLIKNKFKANITESGAEEMARMLEEEARRISEFAVRNAASEKRSKVTKKDISDYRLKGETDAK
jgi:histone H3/H4